jgi:precorrin isomerase
MNNVLDQPCGGLDPIVRIIKKGVFPIVQIGIPILLIVFGTIDLGKAVISSDEKEVKQAQSRLIKRCIYAAAIFFIVTLVTLVMSLVATGADNNSGDTAGWAECWNSIQ